MQPIDDPLNYFEQYQSILNHQLPEQSQDSCIPDQSFQNVETQNYLSISREVVHAENGLTNLIQVLNIQQFNQVDTDIKPNQNTILTNTMKTFENVVAEYKTKIQVLQDQIQRCKTVDLYNQRCTTQLEQRIAELENQVEFYEMMEEKRQKEIEQLRFINRQLIMQQTKQEAEQLRQSVVALKSLLNLKQQQCSMTLSNNRKLSDEILALRRQKQIRSQQIEKQHRLIIQYEKRHEQSCTELKKINQFLQEASKQHVEKHDQTQKLQAEFKEKQQIHKCQIQQITNSYLTRHKNTILKYTEFIKDMSTSFKFQLKQLSASLLNQLFELKQDICNSVSNIPIQSDTLTNQSSSLNREQLLEFQLEELKRQLVQLKVENFQLKYEKKKHDEQKKSKSLIINNLKQQIEILNKRIAHQAEKQVQTTNTMLNEHSNKKGRRNVSVSKEADEKIILQITEMRRRIKHVRQETQTRLK